MLGIKLGAAEFLEKPLCVLKLKNIWQHTVRRMLQQQQQPFATAPGRPLPALALDGDLEAASLRLRRRRSSTANSSRNSQVG